MPADNTVAQSCAECECREEPAAQTDNVNLSLPPPPPPPIPLLKSSVQVKSGIKHNTPTPHIEVADACKRFLGSKLTSSCILACYKQTRAILQDGPMCGLVALEMAGQHVCSETVPTTAEILEEAKKLQYTLQGEMFSAESMGHLARNVLKCEAVVSSDGMSCTQQIVEALLMGRPILVPYDADCNHEPCCKSGHKAHWAVLLGVVFILTGEVPLNLGDYQQDTQIPNLYHVTPILDTTPLLQMSLNSDVYVLAKQGKSTRLGLWSFSALEASNANLVEMDPNRSREECNYIVPKGGIVQGLCRKIVSLNPL